MHHDFCHNCGGRVSGWCWWCRGGHTGRRHVGTTMATSKDNADEYAKNGDNARCNQEGTEASNSTKIIPHECILNNTHATQSSSHFFIKICDTQCAENGSSHNLIDKCKSMVFIRNIHHFQCHNVRSQFYFLPNERLESCFYDSYILMHDS